MPEAKISELTELSEAPNSSDEFVVVDKSDTTQASSGTTKKVTASNVLSNKADDDAVVHDTGNETVAGVKTFSSFPVTPSSAPTTDYQTANKKYVDDNVPSGVVLDTDYNANTILKATADDTPTPLTVGEQTLVGRKTGGDIDALTPAEVRTLINVEDGATADQTSIDGISGTKSEFNTAVTDGNFLFDGEAPAETATTIGALIGGAGDATPNNTDFVATSLTSGGILKKITWTNVKAFLKTYFDTLYGSLTSQQTGWIPAGETYVYVSAQSLKIEGADVTDIFTKGTKIKLTNDSLVKYFYVVSSSFSTDTTVVLSGEVDLANSAITLPYYSYADNPRGFKRGEDWYKANVRLGSNQSIGSGATTIQLDTEEFDTNGDFNTGTYIYTVPISGFYMITARVRWETASGSGYTQFFIYKNGGSLVEDIQNQLTGYFSSKVSEVVQLDKGDAISVRANNPSTSRTADAGNTRFSIAFVGV